MFGNMQPRKGFRLAGMLFLWFVTAMCSTPLQAQFAGPRDTTILRWPDGYADLQLGIPGGEEYCYYWKYRDGTPLEIVSDNVHSSRPFARFREDENHIWVKRVTRYGVEEDHMTVRLTDRVSIDNAELKYRCYAKTDQYTIHDFDITTNPPGHEGLVYIKSITTIPETAGQNPETDEIVLAVARTNDDYEEETMTLYEPVYQQPALQVETSSSVLPDILDVAGREVNRRIERAQIVIQEMLKNVSEKWVKALNVLSYLTPIVEVVPSEVATSPMEQVCCEHDVYGLYREVSAKEYGLCLGIQITLPINGVPFVAQEFVTGYFTFSHKTEPYNIIGALTMDENGDWVPTSSMSCYLPGSVPGRYEVNNAGGTGVSVITPGVLSAWVGFGVAGIARTQTTNQELVSTSWAITVDEVVSCTFLWGTKTARLPILVFNISGPELSRSLLLDVRNSSVVPLGE